MPEPTSRNLTILITDIKGFTDKTSHKSRAEIQTLLDKHKEIVLPVILGRGGKLVKTMGDAFLATFESPTNAVLAGVEAQAALAVYNKGKPAKNRIEIRVAINQGEVNIIENDVFGEPVNITARIEAVADAGDVFFTEAIYLAMNKNEVPSSEVGLLQLKGIPEKVRVYRVRNENPMSSLVLPEGSEPARAVPSPSNGPTVAAQPEPMRAAVVGPIIAVVIVIAGAVLFKYWAVKQMNGGIREVPAASEASAPPARASAPAFSQAAVSPVAARIASRRFPSIALAWGAPYPKGADPLAIAADTARHDLIFSGPGTFRLKWSGPYELSSDSFTPDSVAEGLAFRADLLRRNPNAVLLVEVRYSDTRDDALPADSRWWRRDAQGRRIVGWREGYSQLDFHAADFQDHVAAQCRAAMRTGVVDGCMMNAWNDDDDHLALAKKLRAAAGEDAILLAASGFNLVRTAPYLDGVYISLREETNAAVWDGAAAAMSRYAGTLHGPRFMVFRVVPAQDRPALRRLATTLVLTHSDGYAAYGYGPGVNLPASDWSPFWDRKLGRPLGPGSARADGASVREFEGGTVVYNPLGHATVNSRFPESRTSAALGRPGRDFALAGGDGDLYLK